MTKSSLKYASFMLASALVCGAGMAEDYKWPLCEALPQLIEAGSEATPFKSLSERTQLGESMGYRDAPAGLDMQSDKRRCFVYVAGSPEGVVGGGKYNYVECITWRSKFDDRQVMSAVMPERAKVGGILGTCEALKGWRYAGPAEQPSRYSNDVWTNEETGVQVVAQLEESRTGCKRARCTPRVSHEVSFIVLAPNPSYVDPDEAFRAMKAKQEAEAAAKAAAGE